MMRCFLIILFASITAAAVLGSTSSDSDTPYAAYPGYSPTYTDASVDDGKRFRCSLPVPVAFTAILLVYAIRTRNRVATVPHFRQRMTSEVEGAPVHAVDHLSLGQICTCIDLGILAYVQTSSPRG